MDSADSLDDSFSHSTTSCSEVDSDSEMTLLEELSPWLPDNKGVALVQEAYKYGE